MVGPCYCEHQKGDLSRNSLLCNWNKSFKRFDYCSSDEYCVGPDNADNPLRFSSDTRKMFCKNGKFLFHFTSSMNYNGFIIIRPIFLIYMLGITSCGGNVAYPDCSFCPLDNTTNGIKGCDGNCQINPHNRLCEEKSKLTHKMTFKL